MAVMVVIRAPAPEGIYKKSKFGDRVLVNFFKLTVTPKSPGFLTGTSDSHGETPSLRFGCV